MRDQDTDGRYCEFCPLDGGRCGVCGIDLRRARRFQIALGTVTVCLLLMCVLSATAYALRGLPGFTH